MKLSNLAVTMLTAQTKMKIALALEKDYTTVIRWVKSNYKNSPLTTAAALNIIKEETGLSTDQILTK